MSGRWKLSGYAEPGLYPGANACRFRMVHVRDDGLVLMTVGDQRERGGRLAPVFHGFHFMTVVGRLATSGPPEIWLHKSHETASDAEDGHGALLDEWENKGS